MKFLVDECVGPSVARWLQENNFDTISIYDDFPGIDDNAVLHKALLENRILITSDKDFGEMIFKKKMQHCGVILLRLLDERPKKKIEILENVLKNYSQGLFGNFVVATEEAVRITKPSLS
jgi:predicted nuclease of predicted toxin-antitoxin system